MSNQQNDISLVVKASLDEGNIESEAAHLGNTVASAITQALSGVDFSRLFEQAFAGIGPKMAQALQRGGMDDFGNAMGGGGVSGAGSMAPSYSSNSVTGSMAIGNRNTGAPGFMSMHNMPNASIFQQQFQSDLMNRSMQPMPELNAAYRTDEASNLARVINATKRAGFGGGPTSDERDLLNQSQGTIGESLARSRSQITDFPKQIEALSGEIAQLTKEMASLSGIERDKKASEIQAIDQRRQSIVGDSSRVAAQAEALADQARSIREASAFSGVGGQRMAMGAGALGGAIGFMGELPGMMRSNSAASAALGGMAGRAGMGGDVDRLLALQRIGGTEGNMMSAGMEEGGKMLGSGLGAAAAGIGAYYTGGMTAPMAVGLAKDTISRGANFNGAMLSNIEGRIGSEQQRSQEYYGFLRAGREGSAGAYSAARGMGSPGLSAYLTGGYDSDVVHGNMAEIQGQTGRTINTSYGPGGQSITVPFSASENLARQNELSGLRGQLGNTPSFGGMSMRNFAGKQGLSNEDYMSNLQRIGAAGGGMGLSEGGTARMLQLAGVGVGNAPEAMGGFVQGGMGREGASASVQGLYEHMLNAGMDPTRIQGAIGSVASAGAAGYGAAGTAINMSNASMNAANSAFGSSPGIGQMDWAQRAGSGLGGNLQAGGGLGMVAGYSAIQKLQASLGKGGHKFSVEEQAILQSGGVSAEALESMGIDAKTAAGASAAFPGMQGAAADELGKSLGSKNYVQGRLMGANTSAEMMTSGALARGMSGAGVYGPQQTLDSQSSAAAGATGADQLKAIQSVDFTKFSQGLSLAALSVGKLVDAMNAASKELIMAAKREHDMGIRAH